MLHREVNGGQQQPHPFIRQHLTAGGAGGWPVYLNQVGRGKGGGGGGEGKGWVHLGSRGEG
jgi:hypothetical protein